MTAESTLGGGRNCAAGIFMISDAEVVSSAVLTLRRQYCDVPGLSARERTCDEAKRGRRGVHAQGLHAVRLQGARVQCNPCHVTAPRSARRPSAYLATILCPNSSWNMITQRDGSAVGGSAQMRPSTGDEIWYGMLATRASKRGRGTAKKSPRTH
jgi:hypothetical protein